MDWPGKLKMLAEEHPNETGEIGDKLRDTLCRYAAMDRVSDVALAHARAREAVVTCTRMAIRCGGLLLAAPPDEFLSLLRASGITPEVAEAYILLALVSPELTRRCLRRRGQITEAEAHMALRNAGLLELLTRGESWPR